MDRSPPRIFDRPNAAAKWSRARTRQAAGGVAYLTEAMADDTIDRLGFMRFAPTRALIIGDATGQIIDTLAASGSNRQHWQVGRIR